MHPERKPHEDRLVLRCDHCGGEIEPTIVGVDESGAAVCVACRAQDLGVACGQRLAAAHLLEVQVETILSESNLTSDEVRIIVERVIRSAGVTVCDDLFEVQEKRSKLFDEIYGEGNHDVRVRERQ